MLFGLESDTALNGLCIGRASSSNPGSGWIENGVQGTTGGGGTTKIKLTDMNVVYKVKIVCDIEAGTYDMYIGGEFARNLYFNPNTGNNKTADDVLYTGLYFGLYGGENGRTRFSNIVVTYDDPTKDDDPTEGDENTVNYEIIGGAWDVTKDANGNSVYTSTADDAFLGFNDTTLENNAVIEFDMTLLANGSSMVGMVFGMDSATDISGFCIGRANTSKAGCAWITEGALNGFGSGDTNYVTISYEEGKTYHIRIECDIASGVYEMYVDGVYARRLYFKTSTSAGKESLHTGSYFGLYGGKSGGRTQFSNITIISGGVAVTE
jgi:hypothetical protein